MDKVKGGTPKSINLCLRCRQAMIVLHDNNQMLIKSSYLNQIVKRPVVQCSYYEDKATPDLFEMRMIAWTLSTDTHGRSIGFKSPSHLKEENPIGFL